MKKFAGNGVTIAALLVIVSLISIPCSLAGTPVKSIETLHDLLDLAAERNLQLKMARMSLEQTLMARDLPSTEFDPAWSGGFTATGSATSSGVVYLPSKQARRNMSINYSRPSWDGNRYDFSIGVTKSTSNSAFATFNPSYATTMTLGFRRPMEEDRGLLSLKLPIRKAEIQAFVMEAAFKKELERLLLDVENTYWELVLAKKLLLVHRQSYQLAEELLDLTKNQVDVGVQPPIALTQAKAGLAAREEAVIIAEGTIEDLEEALIIFIDMPLKNREILGQLQLDLPEQDGVSLEPVEQVIALAMDNRPEVLSVRQAVEIEKIEKRLVENRRGKKIDLIGSLDRSGTAGDISTALDQVMNKHHYGWMLGVSWELGRSRAEGLEFDIAEIALIKTMLTLESTIEMVDAEVRRSYRQVEVALKRIASNRSARVLAEEQLEAERERFKLGLSTPYDLLLVENDLSNARASEASALVDLRQNLASLAHSQGLLARHWNVDF